MTASFDCSQHRSSGAPREPRSVVDYCTWPGATATTTANGGGVTDTYGRRWYDVDESTRSAIGAVITERMDSVGITRRSTTRSRRDADGSAPAESRSRA